MRAAGMSGGPSICAVIRDATGYESIATPIACMS
jgi:hypothetical protein